MSQQDTDSLSTLRRIVAKVAVSDSRYDNASTRKATLATILESMTPCQFADELGVHNAHIYRARKGEFSPTLVRAMRREELLPPPKPYPYFKIRRDDPKKAAIQICNTLGQDFALDLHFYLGGEMYKELIEQYSGDSE